MSVVQIIVALVVNAVVAVAALWRRSVTISGAVAGFLTGSTLFGAAGPQAWLLLMVFFLSSTLLGRVGTRQKLDLEAIHEKGGDRDAWQVVANVGPAAILALLLAFTGARWAAVGLAAAFASANADTWASEIGVLSETPPRSILTLRPVTKGASGGVTAAGTIASLGGSAAIAAASIWLYASRFGRSDAVVFAAAIVLGSGFAGAIVDSVLGATLQAQYRTAAGGFTEKPKSGETANVLVRGLRFVTNDVVNLCSGSIAAVAAAIAASAAL